MRMSVAGEVVGLLGASNDVKALSETELTKEVRHHPEEINKINVRNKTRTHLKKYSISV
jgi:hypothetical protein